MLLGGHIEINMFKYKQVLYLYLNVMLFTCSMKQKKYSDECIRLMSNHKVLQSLIVTFTISLQYCMEKILIIIKYTVRFVNINLRVCGSS